MFKQDVCVLKQYTYFKMTQYPHNNDNNKLYREDQNDQEDRDDQEDREDHDDDSDMDDIIEDEQIMEDDIYETKIVNNNTYIGMPLLMKNTILFGTHVSVKSFHKYSTEKVCKFLREMSCSESVSNKDSPEIMKLVQKIMRGSNGIQYTFNTVVIKTMWLRIVQRRWKKLMNERRRIMNGRMTLRNMRHLELTGRHLPEYSVLPHIQGCLADIK
jgi:hypothetical protein